MKTVADVHNPHSRTPHYITVHTSPQSFPRFLTEAEKSIMKFNAYDWAWQFKAIIRSEGTSSWPQKLYGQKHSLSGPSRILRPIQNQPRRLPGICMPTPWSYRAITATYLSFVRARHCVIRSITF